MGALPDSLELTPSAEATGEFVQWQNASKFSLSAPIIEAALDDLINDARMEELGKIFAYWVRVDRDNCDLVRQGLLRFRMPIGYTVNELPDKKGVGEAGWAIPEAQFLRRGLLRLGEAAECIGGQLGRKGDPLSALWAAVFVERIREENREAFEGSRMWRNHRVPGVLGRDVNQRLNKAAASNEYTYDGFDELKKQLSIIPLVKKYLES
jgi:hypothetical protein